jgi:hypothetical protein
MFAIFTDDHENLVELAHTRSDESLQHVHDLTERVRFFISNYRLTETAFRSVNISVLNSDFTILPEAFAEKEDSKSLLQFSSGTLPKNTFVHRFKEMSFNYFMDSELVSLLEKNFRNGSIRHAGGVSADLAFNNRSLKKCDVFLNFNEASFELLAKKDNQLLYYNVFSYDTKEDVLYYLLFMLEQFDLPPQNIRLAIAGQLEVENEIFKTIKKYVKHIDFAIHDNTILKSTEELKLPDHFYFTLFNQHLCEL